MENIIKEILQIDREAIEKQERNKKELEEKETQKKILLSELKEKINTDMKFEIENAKKLLQEEIEAESQSIKSESLIKLEQLDKRYEEISESLSSDAFDIVIRSLEG